MTQPGPEFDLLTAETIPDWERIKFDVHCPRCGYNLRTLSRPRCTECGLDFAWPDVLRESGFKSEFLFEHHWKKRPIRSLVITLWKSLLPRRFWSQVSIHDHLDGVGLRILLLLSLAIFPALFCATAHGASELCLHYSSAGPTPSILGIPILGSPLYVNMNLLRDLATIQAVAIVGLMMLGVLVTTLIVLVNLRQTLGRCRVRPIQVVRVASYAFLPASVLAPLGVLLLGIAPSMLVYDRDVAPFFQAFGILFFWLIFSHYLYIGLKDYLKLPRPRVLAHTSVSVGMLFTLTVLAFVLVQSKGGF